MRMQRNSLISENGYMDTLNLLPKNRKSEIVDFDDKVRIRYLHLGRGGRHSEWVYLTKKICINLNLVKAIGIYYAEGDKSEYRFHTRFSNSEVSVVNHGIELFKAFGISPKQLKGYIKVYNQEIPDGKLVEYWSSPTGIPKENFFRIQKSNSRVQYKRNRRFPSRYGRLEVYFSSVVLRDLVDKLIEIIKSSCLKNQQIATDFLSGLISGEGSIKLFEGKIRETRIASCFEGEQEFIRELLNSLGIKPSKAKYKFYIAISGIRNFKRLRELNAFHLHLEKNNAFEFGLQNLAPGE